MLTLKEITKKNLIALVASGATVSTSIVRQARELNLDLSRLGTALVMRWGAATDAGPVRRRNEDSWLAEPPLYAVADGMGGHADDTSAR